MGSPAIPLQAAGIGTGLVGSYLQGRAEQQQFADKATADQQNQQLAQAQAASALQRGTWEASQITMRGEQQQGQQRAGYAASGVDSNSGSAASIQAATAGLSESDAQMATHNARQQAWGYDVTAQQYGEQAEQDKRAQGQVMVGTLLGGLGGAASGAGRLYGASADRQPGGSMLGGGY
jgi:hypothetical protein